MKIRTEKNVALLKMKKQKKPAYPSGDGQTGLNHTT